jgi:hypothetical protein
MNDPLVRSTSSGAILGAGSGACQEPPRRHHAQSAVFQVLCGGLAAKSTVALREPEHNSRPRDRHAVAEQGEGMSCRPGTVARPVAKRSPSGGQQDPAVGHLPIALPAASRDATARPFSGPEARPRQQGHEGADRVRASAPSARRHSTLDESRWCPPRERRTRSRCRSRGCAGRMRRSGDLAPIRTTSRRSPHTAGSRPPCAAGPGRAGLLVRSPGASRGGHVHFRRRQHTSLGSPPHRRESAAPSVRRPGGDSPCGGRQRRGPTAGRSPPERAA